MHLHMHLHIRPHVHLQCRPDPTRPDPTRSFFSSYGRMFITHCPALTTDRASSGRMEIHPTCFICGARTTSGARLCRYCDAVTKGDPSCSGATEGESVHG
jgi:hypothetical protein